MENAAEALKIAAGVLIFVVALSVCIISFGKVREVSQFIINSNDNDYQNEYVEEVLDSNGNPIRRRIVSYETIIPSIYRAFEENYRVVFDFKDGNEYLYHNYKGTAIDKTFNYIDLQNDDIAISEEEEQRELFINYILYGDNYKYEDGEPASDKVKRIFNIALKNNTPLVDKIKNRKFVETLGVYYINDVVTEDDNPDYEENTSAVTDNNKTQKRIITYTLYTGEDDINS